MEGFGYCIYIDTVKSAKGEAMPEQYLGKIERLVYEAVIQGRKSSKSLQQEIQEIGDVTASRAKFIARDQTSKLVATLNRERNQALGIEEYVWRTSKDERVRPTHRAKEGKTFRWDDPPKDTGAPGEDYNCLPGSAVVDLADGCHKLWRRLYAGPLVSVVTSDGRSLEATPNHPVLTPRGWLPIDQLKEGDYVVHCEIDRRAIGEVNENGLQIRFEDLFESAAVTELRHTARGSKFDFHGDGSENDVDVVRLDRLLCEDHMAALRKSRFDLDLASSDPSLASTGLDRLRSGDRRLSEVLPSDSTNGVVGRGGQGGPLGRGHSAHADEVCGASISTSDQVLREYSTDCASRDAESARDRDFAHPAGVEPDNLFFRKIVSSVARSPSLRVVDLEGRIPFADGLGEIVRTAGEQYGCILQRGPIRYQLLRVIEKSVREFQGHVYNLSNDREWYTANGLIVHNCRCTASPKLKI